MTIQFRAAPGTTERVDPGCSPLIETVLSLHVLVEPRHHPIQHPWVRRARRLPAKLRREIQAFAFSYRNYFPRFLFIGPTAARTPRSFDSELQALALVSPQLAAWELTRPLHSQQVPRDPAVLRRPTVRAAIQAAASGLGEDSAELVRLALEAPGQAMERFRLLLADYWAAGFDAEWERIGRRLAKETSQLAGGVAGGLCRVLEALRTVDLQPRIHGDCARGMLWLDAAHDHEVALDEAGLLLVLSVYAWPHVQVSCDDPWPLGLVVPSPLVIRAAQPAVPPGEALRALRALADDTRLRALRLIAERPRSTQELASLVRLSEAATSNHLRILAAAGIIRARRDGYYVLYGLSEDRLATVWSLLAAYLQTGRPGRGQRKPEEEG